MANTDQTVELTLKWVLDGGRLRALDQSTGAVRDLTRAEKELATAATDANKAMADQQRTASNPARAPTRSDITAELVRSGVSYGGRPDPRAALDKAAARRAEADRHTDAVSLRDEIVQRAINYGRIGVLGRGVTTGGAAGGAAAAGPMLAMIAAKTSYDQYVQARQIDATPFLSPGEARERKLRGLPFGIGRGYGFLEDTRVTLSGELDARRAITESRAMDAHREQLTRDAMLRQDVYRDDLSGLQARATAFAGLKLDRLPSTERETVAGARRYEEESRLLPLRQRLTVAARDRAAAEQSVADATAEQGEREKELAKARERYDKAELRRIRAQGTPTDVQDNKLGVQTWVERQLGYGATVPRRREYNETEFRAAEKDAKDARDKLETAQARADRARGETDRRAGVLTDKESQERQAKVGVTRGDYENAVRRENEARQGARDLVGMGVGGREAVKAYADMARQFGIEALPPEAQAQLEAAAPDTIGKMKEKTGEQYKAEMRGVFPDEPRYQPTAQATRRVDELGEQSIKMQQNDLIRSAEDMLKSVQETNKVVKDKFESIIWEMDKFRNEMMMMNIGFK